MLQVLFAINAKSEHMLLQSRVQ